MRIGTNENPIPLTRAPFKCQCGKALFIKLNPDTGEPEPLAYCRRCKKWFRPQPPR